MNYSKFLEKKAIIDPPTGFDGDFDLPDVLFDFQRDIVIWALKRGRAAIFAGTGLGKTLMTLSWANVVAKKTNMPVLIFTPIAVTHQFINEGSKFGIDVIHAHEYSGKGPCVMVTNYQKMHQYDLSVLGGVVLDESSILKHHQGKYRTELIKNCKNIPYRLAATATPSPNDFMELGNHAEFLGTMSYTDMLSTFFVHDGGATQNWRLKGHADDDFWYWMCSWAVMLTHPKDLGYDDKGYDLPDLIQHQHTVSAEYVPNVDTGFLFPIEATGLGERLKARRATIEDRCDKAIKLAKSINGPIVIWCNLNDESQYIKDGLDGAIEIKGSDKDEYKESMLRKFSDGEFDILITKPSICGFGMNWQHCNNTIFVGLNDSFEQIYQSIRRFWRFGQAKEVHVHFIASELEGAVVNNIKRKENQAKQMMEEMLKHTKDITSNEIRGTIRTKADYNPNETMEIPQWM